jgi:glycosyltransferase involved in cell wall biosynthesis
MLLEALESVFNQTYKGAQILVSDNGSTDGTDAAVSALQNDHPELYYKRHDPPIGPANWTYVGNWFVTRFPRPDRCWNEAEA